jgi:hypothetical protein
MKPPATRVSFVRAAMAGFLTGIAAAIVNVVFLLIYRSLTDVNAYFFVISPVFVFIGIPLILGLSGMLLFVLARYFTRGVTWYTVLFVLLTVFGIIISVSFPRGHLPTGAKGLLIGLEVITGLSAAIAIPYLVRHPDVFMTDLGRDASS